jgi:hypothetical protein
VPRWAGGAPLLTVVDSRKKRPVTVDDVLGELQRDGLVASAAALRMNAPL